MYLATASDPYQTPYPAPWLAAAIAAAVHSVRVEQAAIAAQYPDDEPTDLDTLTLDALDALYAADLSDELPSRIRGTAGYEEVVDLVRDALEAQP